MKQNWTYKKLGEVGTVIGGSTPKTDVAEFWNGDFAWITPAELDGSKYIHSTVRTITKEAIEKTNLTLLPVGTVLLSSRAPIGKVCITTIPMYCNQGFKNIVCSDKLNNEFLYWWLKGKNDYLNSLGVGATFKEISKRIVEQIIIPVPPIETQSRIVSELDLLQSIIDKQKAQIKELDNLAQAVFYDMFGDPVENEKGWEVKRLEDLCEVSSAKRVLVEDVVESGIPFLRGTELTALSKVVSSKDVKFTMFITPEHYERVKSITGVPKKGDILIPSINSEGITWVVDTDEPFYFKDGRVIWVHVNIDAFVSQYLSFVISKILKANYTVLTSGATFLELKLFIIRDLIVPIPPLSLQQSFAAKIESIEKQKAAIVKSIEETQKLFDYTMDKYFG